jgi:hypothetical protein
VTRGITLRAIRLDLDDASCDSAAWQIAHEHTAEQVLRYFGAGRS